MSSRLGKLLLSANSEAIETVSSAVLKIKSQPFPVTIFGVELGKYIPADPDTSLENEWPGRSRMYGVRPEPSQ